MKLLYGTGNAAKLRAMRSRLHELDIELLSLQEMESAAPAVEEDGNTPLENAEKKARAYFRAFGIPVFSCDSGLYIQELPEKRQPAVHVRRVGGKELTDEEMIAYYASLAKQYGRLTAHYENAICLVLDEQHIYRRVINSAVFYLTDKPHPVRKQGFPIDTLSVDVKTGRYYYDLAPQELEQLAVEDDFLLFFREYLPATVMTAKVFPVGTLGNYRYSVVLSEYRGKLLLSRHKERDTWETQGGHIESGETPLESAKRELFEESGAEDFTITPLFDYWAGYPAQQKGANGMVFTAKINRLGSLPDSEMAEVRTFDTLPHNLTYPAITPVLFAEWKNK